MNCKTARYSLSLEIDGRLDEKGLSKLREHLDGCRKCREYEATVRGIGRVLESLPKQTPMNGGWQRLQARMEDTTQRRTVFPRLLAPIGAAIILFAVIAYVGLLQTQGTAPPEVISTGPEQTRQVADAADPGSKTVVTDPVGKPAPAKAISKPKNKPGNKPVIKPNEPAKPRVIRRTVRYANRRPTVRRQPQSEMLASASDSLGSGMSRDLDSLVGQGFSTLVEAGRAGNTNGGGENL